MAPQHRHVPTAEDNRRGILATLAAMALFVCNDALVKLAGAHYPVGQIMVVRGVFATAMMLGIVAWYGELKHVRDAFQVRVLGRGALEAVVALTFIYSVTRMPIGDTTAILQASPIFITVLCAALGLEKVGVRRWMAVLAGFSGVLLVVKPGAGTFEPVALVALLCAALVAVRDIQTRAIPAGVPSSVVSLTTTVTVIVAGLSLGFEDWVPLRASTTAELFGAAAFVSLGNVMIVSAYRKAEASVVSPFRYSVVILAGVFGYFIFGEVPDLLAVLGTALVVGSGIYTLHRERVRRKSALARDSGG